ncbi:TYA transposon family protein [Saccharomyces cerevisiae]|nr:TYA transposon family protein [Saccharomyces cerevisiae]
MESQQLHQNPHSFHGSAYASVTSKEVPSNQDPLAVSASNLPEFDRDSTKVNSQQETTPGTSAVPENHHHVSPQPASVPPPQNGQYQQHGMMTPNKAMASNWAHYQQPSMMTCSHYQTSPAYYQPDPHYPLPQYIPPLSTSSPDPIDLKNQHSEVPQAETKNSNLGDIIPNDQGEIKRQMTYEEHAYIYNTFQAFAPFHLLPTWVKQILEINYADILTVLCKSVSKMQTNNQELKDWIALANLEYDGSTSADTFEITVSTIIQRLKENNINVSDRLACQLILKGLSGDFKYLRNQYRTKTNMKLSQLFAEIQLIYDENKIMNLNKPSQYKQHSEYKNVSRTSPNTTNTKVTTRNYHRTNSSKPRAAKAHNIATSSKFSRVNNDHINESTVSSQYLSDDDELIDAQKQDIPINAIGNLHFNFQNGTKTSIKALHTPNIAYDLLSLSELANQNITACFTRNTLERSDGTVLAPIVKHGDFYWLSKKYLIPSHISKLTINNVNKSKSVNKYPYPLIHRMLGHANFRSIQKSLKKNAVTYLKESDIEWSNASTYQCPDCLIGKSTKHRHVKGSRLKYQESYEPFQYLHTDIFGPVHHLPKSAPSYLYRLQMRKPDSNGFIQMDRGSEYTNKTLHKFFTNRGITACYTTTADSRAHGVAERLNRTLLNDCRTTASLQQHAGLAGLDITTILPFGQPVIVNNHNPDSKIHPRGIPGYALHPNQSKRYVHQKKLMPTYLNTIFFHLLYDLVHPISLIKRVPKWVVPLNQILLHLDTRLPSLHETKSDPGSPNDMIDLTSQDRVNYGLEKHQNYTLGGTEEPYIQRNSDTNIKYRTTNSTPSIDDRSSNSESTTPIISIETKAVCDNTPSIDTDPPEYRSSDHATPNIMPDKSSKNVTADSILDDLHFPDLTHKSPTDTSDVSKDIPHIHSRQTNSSLGGMDDSNVLTTTKSKKRSLEDNETEIEVSRDTWNNKNMRSLEPPRSKKRINLIAAIKGVKSIKPVRTTLRYDEAITYNKDTKKKDRYVEAYHKEISQLLKMNTWDTNKYYDRNDIDPKKVINSMFI